MKILYYDCFSGISGDMHLGALIDAGVNKDYLIGELEKLPVKDYTIEVTRAIRKGIEGTLVTVRVPNEHSSWEHHESGNSLEKPLTIDHSHSHHNHDHEHEHAHAHAQAHNHTSTTSHDHRNLHDIEKIVTGSTLSEKVKSRAMNMFRHIAEAEAKIHGKTIDEIHFHEVGAIDSIVDIVGAAIGIEYLNPDVIMASTVELGGGFVKCAHGLMPVPAPATSEILKGIPVKTGAVPFETTTPTGAAILAANVDEFTDNLRFTLHKTAYGIGQRDTNIPNVLRIYLGESFEKEVQTEAKQEAVMIECNIDDMNPEFFTFVVEKLFEMGADDVFLTPIIMKKGRPANKLSILAIKKLEDTLTQFVLTNTSTIGIRKYPVVKNMLERKTELINTKFGPVNIKTVYQHGKILRSKPEYSDCVALAKKHNLSLYDIYREIENTINSNNMS
jgi:uncharacterized protein (TIGR00299 family) protein